MFYIVNTITSVKFVDFEHTLVVQDSVVLLRIDPGFEVMSPASAWEVPFNLILLPLCLNSKVHAPVGSGLYSSVYRAASGEGVSEYTLRGRWLGGKSQQEGNVRWQRLTDSIGRKGVSSMRLGADNKWISSMADNNSRNGGRNKTATGRLLGIQLTTSIELVHYISLSQQWVPRFFNVIHI